MIGNTQMQHAAEVTLDKVTPEELPQYIANLEKYASRTKEIHWSCDNDKTHILCDELRDEIYDLQDELAEMYMGYTNTKFDLKFLDRSCSCDATTLPELICLLLNDTQEMVFAIQDIVLLRGIKGELEEFIGYLEKVRYKETQK